MVIAILIALVAAIILYFVYQHYLNKTQRKLRTLKHQKFAEKWRDILEHNFDIFQKLPGEFQKKLLHHILVFIPEKSWANSSDDNIKVICAAMACLPIINKKTNYYPALKSGIEKHNQLDWLSMHFQQFSVELGKLEAHKLRDNFSQLSHQFYFESQLLFDNDPHTYQLLKSYYKVDPINW
jgi:Mlc titration factor MtfA (ptsG expression regulator)